MWKRIGKYVLAVVLGGTVATQAPEVAKEVAPGFDPELQRAIAGLIGAITVVIMTRVRSPKDDK